MEQFFTYLFYLFIGVTLINIGYHLLFFVFAFFPRKQAALKAKISQADISPPISIIVCAKNEADNLQKNIPKLLSQDYPKYEIVLINDASIDETEKVMESFALNNDNIVQVNVENNEAFWGSKKYALTLGIKKAQYAKLLFIDADCYPSSYLWISAMAGKLIDKKQLVLGYGGYEKVKGSWVNKLVRYETVLTAMQYFSYALVGKPYMGVGRNLAYTTDLFYEQRGFINHMKIQSGDDDLFVNEAANKTNTAVCFDPKGFTLSEAKTSLGSWFVQKRRHVSVSKHYKTSDKILLGLFYSSQLLFFVLGLVLLLAQFCLEFVAISILIRYLFAWIAFGGSASRLKEKDIVYLFPVYELFLIFFQFSIFSANLFSKPTRWK